MASNKISTWLLQWLLTVLIVAVLAIIIIPAWQNFLQKQALTSGNPEGTSLAERYLIMGNWPASNENSDAIMQYQQYLMKEEY